MRIRIRFSLLLPLLVLVRNGGPEPGMSRPSLTNNNLFPSSSVRARGEKNTHFAIPNGVASPAAANKEMSMSLGASSSPSIMDASELNCSEFDGGCRWRNVDGMFVDELDWYQGSGELDPTRLVVATATNVLPEGQYAIAATDIIQFPTIKAVLVSDQIGCQIGDGEIRFIPSVEKNDPGPVFLNIPDQGPVAFQIYIIADHFTFNSENLKGGFAIIDSIEYYARMCSAEEKSSFNFKKTSSESMSLIPLSESNDLDTHVTAKREADESSEVLDAFAGVQKSPPMQFQLGVADNAGIVDFTPKPDGDSEPKPHKETNEITVTDTAAVTVSTVCEAIVCSFNESEPCSNMASQSDWFLSSEPVGNLLTGVRGDASSLPFNADGSFAYVSGPLVKSRLQTPSFSVDKAVTVVFSYYKADKTSRFQAIVKGEGSEEKVVFEAPKLTRNSRRWFRESLNIARGKYDYVSFWCYLA
uniref:MAM domain-containing protein n=1 Tax=Caenorhabditis japonica TaxID=281687 RepID=A0A8R1HNN1_CAEJA